MLRAAETLQGFSYRVRCLACCMLCSLATQTRAPACTLVHITPPHCFVPTFTPSVPLKHVNLSAVWGVQSHPQSHMKHVPLLLAIHALLQSVAGCGQGREWWGPAAWW